MTIRDYIAAHWPGRLQELATRAGVSAASLRGWRSGSTVPSRRHALGLAMALGRPEGEVFALRAQALLARESSSPGSGGSTAPVEPGFFSGRVAP